MYQESGTEGPGLQSCLTPPRASSGGGRPASAEHPIWAQAGLCKVHSWAAHTWEGDGCTRSLQMLRFQIRPISSKQGNFQRKTNLTTSKERQNNKTRLMNLCRRLTQRREDTCWGCLRRHFRWKSRRSVPTAQAFI